MSNSVHKGFIEGERVAKLSTIVLASMGLIMVGVGKLTSSVSVIADDIDSFLNAVVVLIVWLSLR